MAQPPVSRRPRAKPAQATTTNVSPDKAEAEKAKADKAKADKAKHTSVIYVHGIGSQRRYEETSGLIDSLDTYLSHQDDSGTSRGLIREIEPVMEPLRGDRPGTIGYIRTRLIGTNGPAERDVRFYEIYWAPVMAGQKSPWRIVKWMFSQVLRPYRTLMSPWRDRQRLRRAALVGLYEQQLKAGTLRQADDFRALMDKYDDFEGIPALTRYPDGSFDDFLEFLGEVQDDKEKNLSPEQLVSCRQLARTWLSGYRRTEFGNALALVTVALALVLVGIAVPMMLQFLMQGIIKIEWVKALLGRLAVAPDITLQAAISASLALASIAGVGKILSDYLGDVESWATYEETDEKHVARNKVMDQSLEVLTHVLNDPECNRVAVVAHSLGTSIAHDALLSLTRRNRATGVRGRDVMEAPVPLEKIEHFITMGSPIDKIEYFFESYASASHRYKRVVETLRGDIGTEPFTKNRKPHVHWINFWDAGDQISGALQSPASATMTMNRLDNQEVASFHFPSTGASHAGYFTHRTVIATIFEAVYLRQHSFNAQARLGPNLPYDYDAAYLRLAPKKDRRGWYLRGALLIPWLAAAGGLFSLFDLDGMARLLWYPAGAIALALIVGYFASRKFGHRAPI